MKFYKIYGVIWVSFMTSFFNTVNASFGEAARPEVRGWGRQERLAAPGQMGLGLGFGGWGSGRGGTWPLSAKKAFFPMKHVFFKNREKNQNKTPRYFCPLRSQPDHCQF